MAAVTKDESFVVRKARSLDESRDLWWPLMQELGWNRDFNDAHTHFSLAGDAGWLVIVPEESRKPEGCIVPFTYENGTGWVGFFVMKAAHRGKGWGRALFSALLASYLTSKTSITGLIKVMMHPSLKEVPLKIPEEDLPADQKLVDLREVPSDLLTESDLAHTGFKRPVLWSKEAMFSRSDSWGFGILSATDSSKLLAWVLVRRCQHGHRFGPLYADSPVLASRVIHAAMLNLQHADGSMSAETFPDNPDGMKIFENLGWTWAGVDYHRMWLGGRVPKEQQDGGRGTKGMFAIFDAAAG